MKGVMSEAVQSCMSGARDGAAGWGTALQAGRTRVWFPMVLLEIFIDLILQVALWPRDGVGL